MGLLNNYARQLCSEAKDERGFWCNLRRRPNHLQDCEVLQLVCVDCLGIRYMEREDPGQEDESDNEPIMRSCSRW